MTGTQAATSVVKLRGVTLGTTTPTNGQVLQFNGTQWNPASLTAVLTTGSYADPAWITSLAGSKISGAVASAISANSAGNFLNSLAGDVTGAQNATSVVSVALITLRSRAL